MRATALREWFPTKGQHHAVKTPSALTARSCSAGRQRSLTFAALIRVARVRKQYSNGLKSRGHGTSPGLNGAGCGLAPFHQNVNRRANCITRGVPSWLLSLPKLGVEVRLRFAL